MRRSGIGLAVLLTVSAACAAQSPAGDASRGEALFLKNMCQSCHGTAGQGTVFGPKIAPHPFPWEGFERQVRHPRSVMPRYPSPYVSDRDLADIYAYVASVPEGRPAKEIGLLRE